MNVGELRQALEGVPDDVEVLIMANVMHTEALTTPNAAKAKTVGQHLCPGLYWWANEGKPAFVID